MALFNTHTEDYYKKLIELQEKLRKSEEERLKLEMKFNEMTQITREEEQTHFRKLRSQYKRFLEEDRRRQDRNEKIARSLDRIESRVSMLMAKTERFKLLRQQYHSFLNRIYNNNQRIPETTNAGADVESYIKSLSSDKLNELLHREEDARRRLPFTKPSYSDENPKKTTFFGMADEEIRPNYANSIADDIMNEIFAKRNKELKLKQPAEYGNRNLYDNNPSLFVPKSSETPIETPLPHFREKLIENEEVKYAQGKPVDQTFRNDVVVENPIGNLVQQQFEKLPNNSHNEKLSNVCLSPENQSRLNESKSSEFILEQNENIGMENVNKVLNDVDNIIVDQNNAGLKREMNVGNEVGLIKQSDINENNQLERENVSMEMEKIAKINENQNVLHEESSGAQYPEQINQVKFQENTKNTPGNSQAEQKQTSDSNQEQLDVNAQNMQEIQQYNEREEVVGSYNEIAQPVQEQLDNQQLEAKHQELQEKYNDNDEIVQAHEEDHNQEFNNNNNEQSVPIQHQYDENGQIFQQYNESGVHPEQHYDEQSQPQYDENGQVLQQFDELGQAFQQYDDQSHPMQQYDEQGQPMQQYNDQGQPMQQYDDQSQPMQQYDDQGQPMQQYDDQGPPMQQYDDQGQPMQHYDDQGQPIQQYDDQGQPMQHYDDQGQLMQQYDDQGQLLQYDENGQPIQHQYDINSQYNESGQLIEQYDEQGQLINQYNDHPIEQQQQFDENGQPIEYGQHEAQYDENGQLIQYTNNEQYYNNPEQNGDGEQVEMENPNNVVVEETVLSEQEKISKNVQPPSPEMPKNVMEMLDTDTESAKQDTTKISNDSDFDFSNN